MWPFKKWCSVTKWVDSRFPKYNDNQNAKNSADKAIFLRHQAVAALTNRPYVTTTQIGDKIVDINSEIKPIIDFAQSQRIVALDYPVISRRHRLRGRVFMVCANQNSALNLYSISISDKLGDKIGSAFIPSTISPTGAVGKKECKNIDDTPYWRAAVKLNLYRLMMLKNGAKVDSLTLIALNANYDNFQLIEIPIIDALNRVAYKL